MSNRLSLCPATLKQTLSFQVKTKEHFQNAGLEYDDILKPLSYCTPEKVLQSNDKSQQAFIIILYIQAPLESSWQLVLYCMTHQLKSALFITFAPVTHFALTFSAPHG